MKARIGKLPLMRLHIKRLLEELNICNRRYETLRRVIEGQLGNGRIDTIKEIFPGVVMTIHWTTLTLREHLERVTFFERDGEIVWEALDGAQEAAVK